MPRSGKSILLVANGAPVSKTKIAQLVSDISFILAVDGGANFLKKHNIFPDAVIGDFDSTEKADFKNWINTQWISRTNQNTNDLEKAIDWAIEQGFVEIHITCVLGGRADQSFATYAVSRKFAEQCNIKIHTEFEIITLVSKIHTFASKASEMVSVLPLSVSAEVTSKQLKFPLKKTVLSAGSQGISNVALSDRFTIIVHSGIVLVFQILPSK